MTVEQYTFEDWGYPFIAHDYEGEFDIECPDAILGGIIVDKGDELLEVMKVVQNFVRNRIPAIMVELANIEGTSLESDVITYVGGILEALGYKDLRSYERRLAYGKKWNER